MSILYDSKIPHRPKTLEVTINSSRGINSGLVDMSIALENNPLVTEENGEVLGELSEGEVAGAHQQESHGVRLVLNSRGEGQEPI